MKKSFTYVMTILALGALSACDLGGSQTSQIGAEEANTAMIRAMANMTNMTIGSIDTTLTVDSALSVDRDYAENEYDFYDTAIDVVMDGSVNLKVSDLWGDSPKAALNLNVNEATVHAADSEETFVDVEVTDEVANAYYDGEYAYLDLSQAPSAVEALFGEVDTSEELPTKIKGPASSVEDLGIPDMTEEGFAPTSSEVDEAMGQMLPIMALLPNVTATSTGGVLKIEYSLTQADLPDLIESAMIQIARMTQEGFPSSIDTSLQAIIDAQVGMIVDAIDLEILRIEVQIDTAKNMLKKFEFEIDATLNVPGEEYVDGYYDSIEQEWVEILVDVTTTVDVDSTITFDVNKFSEAVSITFPTDFNTYFEMPTPEAE
ncbi:MAG: hypothetical protein WC399_04870 [Bacilli bacterium]|jgi:hypothetical protein